MMSIPRRPVLAATGVRALVIAAALAAAGSARAATYAITDLGSLGGAVSAAFGINASGQVTGYSLLSDEASAHAFLTGGGVMHDLGTLGGRDSFGQAVNKFGQVTGHAFAADEHTDHAFLYSGGIMTDLGTLTPGLAESVGYGINDAGEVAGVSGVQVGAALATHAFLYSGGAMHDLGTLAPGGGDSYGQAINASGEVAGESQVSDTVAHAFLYSGGVMHDLGSLGGSVSTAWAVNDAGAVAGGSAILGDVAEHAFIDVGGVMTDIGALGTDTISVALGLNNHGVAVGLSRPASADGHGFIYSGGVLSDLNDLIDPLSGWDIVSAQAINDAGQITGYGNVGGELHAYLLTPTVAAGAPEPSTWALLILGGALAGAALRRRRQPGRRTVGLKAMRRALSALTLALASLAVPACAAVFTDGEFESYSQNSWGADPGAGPPASLIGAHFDSFYPSGLTIGATAGHYMLFTSADALDTFLPQTGPAAALNATLVDPISTSSGIFGGQVAGLRLNIDFSDAGLLHRRPGVAFGDLILTGLAAGLANLDGVRVRDLYDVDSAMLAGLFEPYSLTDVSALTMQVNGAFEGAFDTPFAEAHLALPSEPGVPEPGIWSLLILGLGLAGHALRGARRRPFRTSQARPTQLYEPR